MADTVLTVAELAQLLRLAPRTIYNRLNKDPASLPPPTRLPGSRRLLWQRDTVMDWFRQQQDLDVEIGAIVRDEMAYPFVRSPEGYWTGSACSDLRQATSQAVNQARIENLI